MKIKREKWGNKYQVVARDEHGRIFSRAKWGKDLNLHKAKTIFKTNNTFNRQVKREKLKNVWEVIDERKHARKPTPKRSGFVQYFIEGRLPDGTIITARSQQHSLDYPKRKMRDEAHESFLERLAQAQGLPYDAEEGQKALDKLGNKVRMKEGFVYYVAV